ncbi:MAG TPA: hypothetical protein VHB77_14595, partial [Planctomycetaceae bacterium]|nr:hypothetical protein [Planctomycetaceae bacterium]
MAGFIRFSDARIWSSTNWVYWGLMDHLLDTFVNNPPAAKLVEECKWAQSLTFALLREESPESADEIREKLSVVAARIVKGELRCKVDGRELEESDQVGFRDELRRLSEMMREPQSRP